MARTHTYAADQVCNGEPVKGSFCSNCGARHPGWDENGNPAAPVGGCSRYQLEPGEQPLGFDMHEAIDRIASYVLTSGGYDYVDDYVEIRLHDEARDLFDDALATIRQARRAKERDI